jgi:hypothetical protein
MTGGYQQHSLGQITVGAGGAESLRAVAPTGNSGPLLQLKLVTERYGPGETWVPFGIVITVPTAVTGSTATVQLRKNGVAPNGPAGVVNPGTVSVPVQGINTATEQYLPFNPYTFAAADLPGDVWSVFPTVLSTAGAIIVSLVYGIRVVIGVADGVSV